MQLLKVQKLNQSELEQIVDLHLKVLADSSLNWFGPNFLKLIYSSSSKDPSCLFLILKDDHQIIGFALTTKNTNTFYQNIIKQNLAKAPILMLLGFLKHPHVFIDTIHWFFQKKDTTFSAELLFLAVDPKYQRQGLGQKLVKEVIKNLNQEKVKFLVKTGAMIEKSNNFYIKNNFKYLYQKKIMGTDFNFYLSPELK